MAKETDVIKSERRVYEKATIDVIYANSDDVIRTSGGEVGVKWNDDWGTISND